MESRDLSGQDFEIMNVLIRQPELSHFYDILNGQKVSDSTKNWLFWVLGLFGWCAFLARKYVFIFLSFSDMAL